MDMKQEYFRSPAPKNIEAFYSPFKLLQHDQDPNLINTLLSPFYSLNSKMLNSPFSLLSHQNSNYEEYQIKNKEIENKKIDEFISFSRERSQQSDDDNIKKEQYHEKQMEIANEKTAQKKRYNLRNMNKHSKIKSTRDKSGGLKTLSKQAFDILYHSSPLTYREVAQRVIQQTQDFNQQYPKKKKQKKSIKRRIYDALNVLIAVGILQKNEKKISLTKNQYTEKQKLLKNNIQKQYFSKIKLISYKKKRIQKIKQQTISIKKLIKRNINTTYPEIKINFPFLIGSKLIETPNKQFIEIKQLHCTDLDAIDKLNISQIQ